MLKERKEFMLKVEHITKYYDQNKAVDDLSFEVEDGKIFGLLGVNGAGKTTTFRMIIGLLEPTSGKITLDGKPIDYNVTDTIGFTMQQWLWTWGTMHITCIVGDVVWGIVADKIGWKRQVMLFGCIGCGITTLLFYYLPILSGDIFAIAILCAVLFGITQSAFVPIFAIFTALEPEHIGATLSSHNLAAGLSNFAAPAIATLFLPIFNEVGVVWAFAICYFVGAVITYFIKVHQPGIDDRKVTEMNKQTQTN